MFDTGRLLKNFYFFRRNYYKSLLEFWSYLYIKIYFGFAIVFNIGLWLWARSINSNIGQEQMALHYSVDFGIDLYGDATRVFFIPLLGLMVIIINCFILLSLGRYRFGDAKFVSHILLVSALVTNFILFAAILSIYFINFR